MREDISIYIHIPFCKKKCYYCDFVSFDNKEDMIEKYINALCEEILKNAEILCEYNIKSIYFGGGTPSFIPSKYIVQIMDTLKLFISDDITKKEITIEVNPNSATFEKLSNYYSAGINRISIGLQTTHDKILKNIGRSHTFVDFKNTLKAANDIGFRNISLDLIYPLPGLHLNMFKDSLQTILNLKNEYNIKHISVYNLEIHPNTRLEFLLKEKFMSLCSEDEEYEMRTLLNDTLEKNGFTKYEISNYAKEGFKSKHNLCYWNQDKYLGFGVNSSSFFNGKRYQNTKSLDEYISFMSNDKDLVIYSEELDKLALMKEYAILRLRLKEGINLVEFKKKFNTNFFDIFNDEISSLQKDNLVFINKQNNSISLTKRGEEVANIVWEIFI